MTKGSDYGTGKDDNKRHYKLSLKIWKGWIPILVIFAMGYYAVDWYQQAFVGKSRYKDYSASILISIVLGVPEKYSGSKYIINKRKNNFDWDKPACFRTKEQIEALKKSKCRLKKDTGEYNCRGIPQFLLMEEIPLKKCLTVLNSANVSRIKKHCDYKNYDDCIFLEIYEEALKFPGVFETIINVARRPCDYVLPMHKGRWGSIGCDYPIGGKPKRELVIINIYDGNLDFKYQILTRRED
jgi:hypothetical protein